MKKKREYGEERTRFVGLRLSELELLTLDLRAMRAGLTRAEMMRRALQLDEEKTGQPFGSVEVG